MTVKYQTVVQQGLGLNVGRCLGVFYTDKCMVGARDSEWLQNALNIRIGLFWRYRLVTNIANYRRMMCQPGALWSGTPEEAVGRRCTGLWVSYHERLRRRIPCPERGVELTDGSITAHQIRMYGTCPSIDWNQMQVSQTKHLPQVYDVSFPKGMIHYP